MTSAAEVYEPDGVPACPFCGSEVEPWRSKIALAIHLGIEALVASEPGSEEFDAHLAELARRCGGGDDG